MARKNRQTHHTVSRRLIVAVLTVTLLVTVAVPCVALSNSPIGKEQWQDSMLSSENASEGKQSIVPMSSDGPIALQVEVLSNTAEYTGQPVYPELRFTKYVPKTNPDEGGDSGTTENGENTGDGGASENQGIAKAEASTGEEVKLTRGDFDDDGNLISGDYGFYILDGSEIEASENGYDWFVDLETPGAYNAAYQFVNEDGEAVPFLEGHFTIKPKAVAFTAANLTHGTDGETACKAVVTAEGLVEGKDFTVRYAKQKEDGTYDEVETTTEGLAYNTYKIIITLNDPNYRLGSINGKPEEFMVIGKQFCKLTFNYNNNDIPGFEGQESVVYQVEKGSQVGADRVPPDPKVPPSMKWIGWFKKTVNGEWQLTVNDTVEIDTEYYAKWGDSDNASLSELQLSKGAVALPFVDNTYETEKPFSSLEKEYYLRVDKDTSEITVSATTVEPKSRIQIVINNQRIDPIESQSGSWTVPLNQATTSSMENFLQVIVTAPDGVSKTPYTVRILRLREPTFTLGCGNSPYGRIMTEVIDKEGAKADFDVNRVYDGIRYNTLAWADYKDYDGDRDETAVFIGQRTTMKDAPLSVISSQGKAVNLNDVTRTITLKTYSGGLLTAEAVRTAKEITISGKASEQIQMPSSTVVPGVYDMVYSYIDPVEGRVTAVRKCVVTGRVGDVDLNTVINPSIDAGEIEKNIFYLNQSPSLYRFRVVDVQIDQNDVINLADSAMLERVTAMDLPVFYPEIR